VQQTPRSARMCQNCMMLRFLHESPLALRAAAVSTLRTWFRRLQRPLTCSVDAKARPVTGLRRVCASFPGSRHASYELAFIMRVCATQRRRRWVCHRWLAARPKGSPLP
jgi:hypothetical protein